MEDTTGYVVRLPDGKYVTIHHTPQHWWNEPRHVGYIAPELLAPDLDQPRQEMVESELEELQIAIAAAGVREPITVTLRQCAPWIRVEPQYENRPFAIVSGHRRHLSATRAGVPAVPVRVVLYDNETQHRDDAVLLNGQRHDMSPMDEARDIKRRLTLGERPEAIARSYGKNNVSWVHSRNALNNLAPALQALLNPTLTREKQLPVVVAIRLGSIKKPSPASIAEFCDEYDLTQPRELGDTEEELAHTMQLLMYEVIQGQKMTAIVACHFVENTRRATGSGARATHKSEKYEPRKRVEALLNYLKSISQGLPTTWSGAEFTRICAGQTRLQMGEHLALALEAGKSLVEIIEHLETIERSKPHFDERITALLTAPVAPVQKFTPRARTMADMPPEEVAAIKARLGLR